MLRPRGTRDQALDLGVDERALIRYANGACAVYEHRAITDVVARNEWALNYVVHLVKSKRKRNRVAA